LLPALRLDGPAPPVEDFRLLVARAAALEDTDPPADLWPGIAYRLDERPARGLGWAGVWGRRLAIVPPTW